MALENYTDLSIGGSDVGAGFQFEFCCAHCSKKWKSSFKPYRMGQLTGILTRFAFLIPGMNTYGRAGTNFSDMGSRGAKDAALAEARTRADTLYTACPSCRKSACADCFDEHQDLCVGCLDSAKDKVKQSRQTESGTHAVACPNCQTAHDGGRFCAECGFDMAGTHKNCPGCSTMLPRAARFCTDCGHGF